MLVVWAESVVLVVWVELAGIALRLYRLAGTAAIGSTIPNIAAAPPTRTAPRRTGLAERRGATHLQTASRVRASRSAGRAETSPVTAPEASATELAEPGLAIDRWVVDPIASAVATSPAVAAETVMHSAAVRADTADQTPAAAAAEAHRVCLLAVAASVVAEAAAEAVAVGAGNSNESQSR